jgi:hypothetical protein
MPGPRVHFEFGCASDRRGAMLSTVHVLILAALTGCVSIPKGQPREAALPYLEEELNRQAANDVLKDVLVAGRFLLEVPLALMNKESSSIKYISDLPGTKTHT